jgi:2-iminobutanoate/2-iminopropanoate deaminase
MPIAITTQAAPAAIGPYSQAVQAGSWLFLSGQIPLLPETGALCSEGVEEQAAQVLENLCAVLRASGAEPKDVVKTTIYLVDLADFAQVNAVYARYFEAPYPARATVQVAALPKQARVEIDAIAIIERTTP